MDSESNIRHGQLQAAGAIRPSLAWCFSKGVRFGSLGIILELASCDSESNVRHGQLQAAGAIRPSLALCFSVAKGSVLEA